MHSNSIQGSVVVITGASSGIGLSTAKALAKRRARLVLVARGQDGLDSAKQACELLGATVLTLSADVIDETSMHDGSGGNRAL